MAIASITLTLGKKVTIPTSSLESPPMEWVIPAEPSGSVPGPITALYTETAN